MKFMTITDFYFLTVIALIKSVRLFPWVQLKSFMVRCIVFTAYRVLRDKRQLSEKHLSEVFDEKFSKDQMKRIIKRSFYVFWYDTFSLLPSSLKKVELRQTHLHGAEHLQMALKNGKGVIIWENSVFGRRILAKQILHENGFAVHQVHAENHLLGGFTASGGYPTWMRNHKIKPFFEKCEKHFVSEIIYLPNSESLVFTRILLGRLKQNGILCIAGGGRFGQKLIPIRFLGRTETLSTGIVSLSKISGAPILPMFCIQEENGETTLIIELPLLTRSDVDRERGLESIAAQYVSLLESYIRKYPEQYQNWHFARVS
jgi:lauroyl/myristoyl acyltransferase